MIGMIKKSELEVGYQLLCDMRVVGMHDTNRKKSDWYLRESMSVIPVVVTETVVKCEI